MEKNKIKEELIKLNKILDEQDDETEGIICHCFNLAIKETDFVKLFTKEELSQFTGIDFELEQ